MSAKRRSTPGGITGLGLRLTLADQWRRKMYTALRSSTSVSSNSCSGLVSAVYDSISSVNVRLFCVGARKPPIPAASIGACRLINVLRLPSFNEICAPRACPMFHSCCSRRRASASTWSSSSSKMVQGPSLRKSAIAAPVPRVSGFGRNTRRRATSSAVLLPLSGSLADQSHARRDPEPRIDMREANPQRENDGEVRRHRHVLGQDALDQADRSKRWTIEWI